MFMRRVLVSVLPLFIVASGLAAEPGRASGTFTLDGKTSSLAYAISHEEEDVFDSTKMIVAVVLVDRDVEAAVATVDWELAQGAKTAGLVSLALRFDGAKLAGARLNAPGLDGTVILPSQWFTYRPAGGAAGPISGQVQMAPQEWDGHTYACSVEFTAAPAAPAAEPEPEAEPAEEETPPPDLPPATTSTLDPDSLTPLMVQAIMEKDEAQVLKLLKLGANPNARDPYGIPMLNWAVMSCLPQAVQALVDAKADLAYERAPGMTILMEAGACPEAEKILRAAGAK